MGLDFYGFASVAVFAGVVAVIALGVLDRALAGGLGVLLLLLIGAVSFSDVLGFVDWDVVLLVVLMSFYSIILEESGLAKWVAFSLVERIREPRLLVYSTIMACGILSLFLENSVTVFVFAPIAFQLARSLSLSPTPLLIGMGLAAGMAGSATMVGDPPAMIAAGRYGLSFTDFIIYEGRLSMFFITIIPMILAIGVYTLANFRGSRGESLRATSSGDVRIDRVYAAEALFFLLLKILLLSIRRELEIPMSLAALIAVTGVLSIRVIMHKDTESVVRVLTRGFDARLPVFLISIFVLSNTLKKHSVTDSVANAMVDFIGLDLLNIGLSIFAISVALSALIENIPVTLTLLPIADTLSEKLAINPVILAWGVLSGLTAGGGWTYIGSGANVVAVHVLEKEGHRVSFISFSKTALPFNLVNTMLCLALYALLWLAW